MEEELLKDMKKYKRKSMVGIIIFILLVLLQIGYYMYWNNSCSTPSPLTNQYITQEIEAFNSQFDSYIGNQRGVNVKSLLTKLKENSKVYDEDDYDKIPEIIYEDSENYIQISIHSEPKNYSSLIDKVKNRIDNKNNYKIEIEYSEFTRLINLVKITKTDSEIENIITVNEEIIEDL